MVVLNPEIIKKNKIKIQNHNYVFEFQMIFNPILEIKTIFLLKIL